MPVFLLYPNRKSLIEAKKSAKGYLLNCCLEARVITQNRPNTAQSSKAITKKDSGAYVAYI